ncbi:MAG: metalloregulator ArsR/SmtB family transcription factor [Actinomycetota bacterium]
MSATELQMIPSATADVCGPDGCEPPPGPLDASAAETYASWFATLADPTRVQVLHAVATATSGLAVGALARQVGIAQPTVSHHVKLLSEAGFVTLEKVGTSTIVRVNEACCSGLPHAADVVMGTLDALPCCPDDVPSDVTIRALTDEDWDDVRRIMGEGIATRLATFETEVASVAALEGKWLANHRPRDCYSGVAETQIYVAEAFRGRRVGVALIDALVRGADAAGLWTLQAVVFPENRASLRLHRSAGFRTVGVRDRIAQLDGEWRDTVLMERRR